MGILAWLSDRTPPLPPWRSWERRTLEGCSALSGVSTSFQCCSAVKGERLEVLRRARWVGRRVPSVQAQSSPPPAVRICWADTGMDLGRQSRGPRAPQGPLTPGCVRMWREEPRWTGCVLFRVWWPGSLISAHPAPVRRPGSVPGAGATEASEAPRLVCTDRWAAAGAPTGLVPSSPC